MNAAEIIDAIDPTKLYCLRIKDYIDIPVMLKKHMPLCHYFAGDVLTARCSNCSFNPEGHTSDLRRE